MQYILYNIRFGYSISVYIVTMEFTDMYNFDSANIKRECNFMIELGRVIPFSPLRYWTFSKFKTS